MAAGKGYWEQWTLNAHITKGEYRAGRVQGGFLSTTETVIALKDGHVRVEQPEFGRSEAEAPANYIPEGVVELAWYLTARGGEPGRFRMVFNEMPPSGGRVQFGQMLVEEIVRSADGWQVEVRSRMGGPEETVSFDNGGRIIRRQRHGGDVVERPAAPQEVAAAFPGAAGILRRILVTSRFSPPRRAKRTGEGMSTSP